MLRGSPRPFPFKRHGRMAARGPSHAHLRLDSVHRPRRRLSILYRPSPPAVRPPPPPGRHVQHRRHLGLGAPPPQRRRGPRALGQARPGVGARPRLRGSGRHSWHRVPGGDGGGRALRARGWSDRRDGAHGRVLLPGAGGVVARRGGGDNQVAGGGGSGTWWADADCAVEQGGEVDHPCDCCCRGQSAVQAPGSRRASRQPPRPHPRRRRGPSRLSPLRRDGRSGVHLRLHFPPSLSGLAGRRRGCLPGVPHARVGGRLASTRGAGGAGRAGCCAPGCDGRSDARGVFGAPGRLRGVADFYAPGDADSAGRGEAAGG
mmetsp:Transcript_123752/g.283735  ORF Transcript_123752/g.283735 Transcript_123752/m.283735 type:complete len:317 (-) Transcript_123752:351-1301(-)